MFAYLEKDNCLFLEEQSRSLSTCEQSQRLSILRHSKNTNNMASTPDNNATCESRPTSQKSHSSPKVTQNHNRTMPSILVCEEHQVTCNLLFSEGKKPSVTVTEVSTASSPTSETSKEADAYRLRLPIQRSAQEIETALQQEFRSTFLVRRSTRRKIASRAARSDAREPSESDFQKQFRMWMWQGLYKEMEEQLELPDEVRGLSTG